ncbi:MAG: Ger(x)C family spore germination protein [Anaerovorax sp.]|nr:Ger(x)C family spore germination protein [Anaerovorax sp.]
MKKANLNTMLFLCLILCFSMMLTGCKSMKEINDMSILSGAAIDFDTVSNRYRVTGEIVNKSISTASEDNVVETIYADGRSLAEAIENCNEVDSRETYWSHAKTFVISNSIAKNQGITPLLDYVLRNYKMRISINLLVSNLPHASQVLDLKTSSTNIKFLDLDKMLVTSQGVATAAPTKVYQAIDILKSEGIQLSIPIVSAREDMAIVNGTAIFREDKLVGTLNQEETIYFLFLQNRVDRGNISTSDGSITFRIENNQTKLLPKTEDGKTVLQILIKTKASISQISSSKKYTPEELEMALQKNISDGCQKVISKMQKDIKSDAIGFGKAIKEENATLWDLMRKDWDVEKFPKLPVELETQVKLQLGETH